MWTRLCRFRKTDHTLNLPKPKTANNYDKIENRLNIVVKEAANQTMREANQIIFSPKVKTQMMIQLLTLLYRVMVGGRKGVIPH